VSARSLDAHPATGGTVVADLVRVALLARLLALLAAVVGMAVTGTTWPEALLLVLLSLTSHLGLQNRRILRLVVRRPALALLDVVLVLVATTVAGATEPLAFVALSSALLVGVLYTVRTTALLGAVLVAGALAPAVLGRAEWAPVLGLAGMVASVALIGTAVRLVAEQHRLAEKAGADARAAAAAAEERLRLARDLHDTVAKSLQGVALTASALPGWIRHDPRQAADRAQGVAAGAREALVTTRNLLSTLRIDDPRRPFHEVVRDVVTRWAGDRPCSVDVQPVPGLPSPVRHELLAALAEALANVSRHCPHAAAAVTLAAAGGEVLLVVVDDGPGFPAQRIAEAESQGRYGLVGVRERMAAAGGRAEIASYPGRGTSVLFTVPSAVQGSTVATAAAAVAARRLSAPTLRSVS
jgi:signal transduction histidine kinase